MRQPPQCHDLLDTSRERQSGQLGNDGQAPRDRRAVELGNVLPEQAHLAGPRRQQAGQDAQKGRLAGPVRADQGDPFLRSDRQVDVADHVPAPIPRAH